LDQTFEEGENVVSPSTEGEITTLASSLFARIVDETSHMRSPAVVRPQYRSPQAEEQETYSRSNVNAEDMQALAYGMISRFFEQRPMHHVLPPFVG